MKKKRPTRDTYILDASLVFHWAKYEDYSLLLTGKERSSFIEEALPRLVDAGKLIARKYGPRKIYVSPRFINPHWRDPGFRIPEDHRLWKENHFHHVDHGLACTNCQVRTWRSDLVNSEVIAERFFRGGKRGSVPDWGIRYKNTRVLLLFEFITEKYFYRSSELKRKITRYLSSLHLFREIDGVEDVRILTVIDVPRQTLQEYLDKLYPVFNGSMAKEAFYFSDYHTFCQVPLGHQLSAEIYLWAGDGNTYSLGVDHA